MIRKYYILPFLILLTFVSACSPKPAYQGLKIGKPYEISGHVYIPKYNPDYDETGIASWYGPGFHGEHTASGERYNQDDFTAAHKTLPLPSIVRVTNLNNGKSAILRINDRGPFASGRIIDLSRASAVKLGIYRAGTAKVRVQFLDYETREYVSNLPNGRESLKILDRIAKSGDRDNTRKTDIADNSVDDSNYNNASSSAETKSYAKNTVNNPSPFISPAVVAKPVQVVESVQPSVQRIVSSGNNKPGININQSVSASGYFIQAGTFGVRDNADRMLRVLEEMGNARIVENTSKNRKLYRVLSGPYNSRSDAENMLGRLDTAGVSGAKIVHDL